MTLLEGMYAGVVPVVAPLPAYADVFEEGARGVIVDSSPQAMAEEVARAVRAHVHEDSAIVEDNRRLIEAHHDQRENMKKILRRIVEVLQM